MSRADDHSWEVEFASGGGFTLKCLDPCEDDDCWCGLESEVAEMLTGKLAVKVHIETEHTPSTVNGPEEWDSWAEVSPADTEAL